MPTTPDVPVELFLIDAGYEKRYYTSRKALATAVASGYANGKDTQVVRFACVPVGPGVVGHAGNLRDALLAAAPPVPRTGLTADAYRRHAKTAKGLVASELDRLLGPEPTLP